MSLNIDPVHYMGFGSMTWLVVADENVLYCSEHGEMRGFRDQVM